MLDLAGYHAVQLQPPITDACILECPLSL